MLPFVHPAPPLSCRDPIQHVGTALDTDYHKAHVQTRHSIFCLMRPSCERIGVGGSRGPIRDLAAARKDSWHRGQGKGFERDQGDFSSCVSTWTSWSRTS